MSVDPYEDRMRAHAFEQFDGAGVDQVRLSIEHGELEGLAKSFAVQWLAKFEAESRLQRESDQAEIAASAARSAEAAERSALAAESQARTAKYALAIAILAATTAIIALINSLNPFL